MSQICEIFVTPLYVTNMSFCDIVPFKGFVSELSRNSRNSNFYFCMYNYLLKVNKILYKVTGSCKARYLNFS